MCAMCEGLVGLCNDVKVEALAEAVFRLMERCHMSLEEALETIIKPEQQDEVREKVQAMQKGDFTVLSSKSR